MVNVVTLTLHHGFLNHVMMPLVKLKKKIMGIRYVKLTRNVLRGPSFGLIEMTSELKVTGALRKMKFQPSLLRFLTTMKMLKEIIADNKGSHT
jgi:hypothetical protein